MENASAATFPRWRLWVTVILCIIECLFFGATLTGWASLIYVYKDEGVFSHLCEEVNQITSENHQNTMEFSSAITLSANQEFSTKGQNVCSVDSIVSIILFSIA